VPLGPGQPASFLHALGEREGFERLVVFAALLMDFFPLFTRPGVRLLSGFFGPVERALRAAGHDVEFVPSDFRGFSRLARRIGPRVMATAAAPPGADGSVSLSLHAGATIDELRCCGRDPNRILIVEVNAKLPRTYGLPPEYPHAIRAEEIDVLVESEADLLTIPDPPAGPVDRAIADHVRFYVRSGCTLQTGIGAIPSEVAEFLASSDGGDYGIHSEMFTTGLMKLHQAGKVTNRKGVFDGFSVATFAAGTQELYRWLHERQDVRFLPVEVVNDPAVIARNRRMISINGALAVDLQGQLVADTIGSRQYSGIGGHEDFVAGGGLSEAGASLVCLPSTVSLEGQLSSRIVATLAPYSLVTTPRHHVEVVITEYGRAELFGKTVAERARELIQVAHPRFRDRLRDQALAQGLISSGP
jgi:acyl-CoA hydrolase